eukprot:c13043_g1_i1 orf=1-810(-)
MSTVSTQACAACKYQRRKCSPDCPLAPYFPPDQPKQFLNVHRLFGVSNVLRILRQVDPAMKADTIKSIVYEADAWERDPVHGCLGLISILQSQVEALKSEVDRARNEILLIEHSKQINNLQSYVNPALINTNPLYVHPSLINTNQSSDDALGSAWIYSNYGQLSGYQHEPLGVVEGSSMFEINAGSHEGGRSMHCNYDPILSERNHDLKIEVGGEGATPFELHEAVSHHGSHRVEYPDFQGASRLPSSIEPNINLSHEDQEDLKTAATLF